MFVLIAPSCGLHLDPAAAAGAKKAHSRSCLTVLCAERATMSVRALCTAEGYKGRLGVCMIVRKRDEAISREGLKAELARRFVARMKELGLTHTVAAKFCGVWRPHISAVTRGELYGFSCEQLIGFLMALGLDVEIVVRPTKKPPRWPRVSPGKLTVR
jgi:predicted XRE-type DNA-binding protein